MILQRKTILKDKNSLQSELQELLQQESSKTANISELKSANQILEETITRLSDQNKRFVQEVARCEADIESLENRTDEQASLLNQKTAEIDKAEKAISKYLNSEGTLTELVCMLRGPLKLMADTQTTEAYPDMAPLEKKLN